MLKHLAVLWVVGGVTLAAATWICFTLHLNSAAVGFVYLAIIVLLSLQDSFVSSAFFALSAVALLDYYFIPPLFSFQIQYDSDIPALGTFVLSSFVITSLVRRLRHSTEARRRQAELLDLTHDTVIVRDSNDVITFWNGGAERQYGWSRDEAVGKVSHALLQTVFPQALEPIKDQLQHRGHWEGELVHTRKDGGQVIVASRWSLQRDAGGQPIGTLETNNDITERKRAEELLRRSQAAYLGEAQKLSLTGSLGWNLLNGEVFWSDQCFIMLGYEPTVQPSIPLVLERVHPDDVVSVREAIESASRDRSAFDLEFRLLLPDGAVKHIHAVAHLMAGNGSGQFVGALMDNTEAKRAEARLQEAQAQMAHVARVTSLGALSASLAHEVNQPLAAIVSHGEASLRWLNREVPRLDEVAASIQHVIANGKRASGIVQRIRGLTTKSAAQRQPLNLNELVEEVIPLVRNEVARSRALLRLDLAADLPLVHGDPIQLQQVIINLVVNALQAMLTIDDRARVVRVATHWDGASQVLLLDVEDSGPGIDPDHGADIFNAFYTTKPGGMGMGLSICRSIIEAHGGQINVLPREIEPGALFRCSLPTRPDAT